MTNNPYFPNRKIRHADLLTKAGFVVDERWYRNKNEPQRLCNVTKLIYWINPKTDVRITFFDYQQISLKTFIERISGQVEYNLKKKASVTFSK
jgi:hypothetical protein